jgi:hypothetical protein
MKNALKIALAAAALAVGAAGVAAAAPSNPGPQGGLSTDGAPLAGTPQIQPGVPGDAVNQQNGGGPNPMPMASASPMASPSP